MKQLYVLYIAWHSFKINIFLVFFILNIFFSFLFFCESTYLINSFLLFVNTFLIFLSFPFVFHCRITVVLCMYPVLLMSHSLALPMQCNQIRLQVIKVKAFSQHQTILNSVFAYQVQHHQVLLVDILK